MNVQNIPLLKSCVDFHKVNEVIRKIFRIFFVTTIELHHHLDICIKQSNHKGQRGEKRGGFTFIALHNNIENTRKWIICTCFSDWGGKILRRFQWNEVDFIYSEMGNTAYIYIYIIHDQNEILHRWSPLLWIALKARSNHHRSIDVINDN